MDRRDVGPRVLPDHQEESLSIFDRIKHAIFGEAQASHAPQVSSTAATSASSPAPPATAAAPASSPATPSPAASSSTPSSQANDAARSATTGGPLDVESILNEAVKKSGQKLDWRHSIVDLMKALGMDASLEERKELAQELGYSGDTHDSAKMNTFLHKALMKKLADNGGRVPADLLD